MKFHEVANIFPLLQGEEFEDFCQDIQKNGLLEPIWLHPNGQIIDGRNRYRACQKTGVKPEFRTWDGQGILVGFVLSLNLHRRHLTPGQLAVIGVEAELFYAKELEANKGGRPSELNKHNTEPGKPVANLPPVSPKPDKSKARDYASKATGVSARYISDAKRIKRDAPEIFEQIKSGELNIPQAKQKMARAKIHQSTTTPPLPENKYRCIVIDPPWPMKKIEREERPDQGIELDYPIMTLDEIKALPIADLAASDGCHLYLWVTQKYLPFGLELVNEWGFNYQCLMTWRKNVGITPFSWMYDTEHVIFARRGNLPLNQLGLRLSFDAKVSGHSVKPDIFFNDRVILASPAPRLEMFARKGREGFTVWGDEVNG